MKQSCISICMVILLLATAQSAVMASDYAYPIDHNVTPAFQQVYQGVEAVLDLHSRDYDYWHGAGSYDLLAFSNWPPEEWTPTGPLERAINGWYTQTCTRRYTSPGNYQISIGADDTPGLDNDDPVSKVVEIEVLLDNTPPVPGTADSPAIVAGSPISVTYSGASDTQSGLDHVELWYKKETGGTWTNSLLTSTGESGSFSFPVPGGLEGTYYFDLVAVDNAGNRSAEASGDGDCSTIYRISYGVCGFSYIISIPVNP